MADAPKAKSKTSTVKYDPNDVPLSINRVCAEINVFNETGWILTDWKTDAKKMETKLTFERLGK